MHEVSCVTAPWPERRSRQAVTVLVIVVIIIVISGVYRFTLADVTALIAAAAAAAAVRESRR